LQTLSGLVGRSPEQLIFWTRGTSPASQAKRQCAC